MENWRRFTELSKRKESVIYLKEGKKMTPVSFDDRLSDLKESKGSADTFLKEWNASVDHVLKQGELNEGVMDLLSQAANVLSTVGKKSWGAVTSVTSKVSGFIDRFKESHPDLYKGIKYAIIAVLCIGMFYLIMKVAGKDEVAGAMEQIASFEFPDSTISGLVKDLAGQGTVDTLRALRAGLHETAGESINYLMQSGNPVLEGLGDKLYELVPDAGQIKQAAADNFWEEAMEAAKPDMSTSVPLPGRDLASEDWWEQALSAPANPRMPGN
tara:strand:- start:189 stop:998 length:810 start_codon:yes stop_codon:yes gene_type:complete